MPELSLTIRPERPSDAQAVERLNARAFGPGRFARTAHRAREGADPAPAASFVAFVATLLVGSVRVSPVRIGSARALLLGPIAVEPAFEGRGIGSLLMTAAIDAARDMGEAAILLVGDEAYYRRFGFRRAPPDGPRLPGPVDPARFLALELKEGALAALQGDVRPWRS